MAVLSDGVTIGVVLLLLFGALFFYLWLRIQQVEKRGLLLENILLDLKLTTESTMGDFPEPAAAAPAASRGESQSAFVEEESDEATSDYLSEVSPLVNVKKEEATESTEEYTSVLDEILENSATEASVVTAVMPSATTTGRMGSSYESMTLKDLKALAKTRKISGFGSLTRAQLIQQLKEKDQVSSLWGSTAISEESTEGVLDNMIESAEGIASSE
jgi:hypothetical protein